MNQLTLVEVSGQQKDVLKVSGQQKDVLKPLKFGCIINTERFRR